MATMQMSVRPEDLSQIPHGGERIPESGNHGDLRSVGRPDQAQAAACALSSGAGRPAAEQFAIVGVARRPLGDEFAADMRAGIVEFGGVDTSDPKLDTSWARLAYFPLRFRQSCGLQV
jgi:glucose-6-phosphate 1-dehydrogenase